MHVEICGFCVLSIVWFGNMTAKKGGRLNVVPSECVCCK